jgi:hypothetical protein
MCLSENCSTCSKRHFVGPPPTSTGEKGSTSSTAATVDSRVRAPPIASDDWRSQRAADGAYPLRMIIPRGISGMTPWRTAGRHSWAAPQPQDRPSSAAGEFDESQQPGTSRQVGGSTHASKSARCAHSLHPNQSNPRDRPIFAAECADRTVCCAYGCTGTAVVAFPGGEVAVVAQAARPPGACASCLDWSGEKAMLRSVRSNAPVVMIELVRRSILLVFVLLFSKSNKLDHRIGVSSPCHAPVNCKSLYSNALIVLFYLHSALLTSP